MVNQMKSTILSPINSKNRAALTLLLMGLPPFFILCIFTYLPLAGWVYALYNNAYLNEFVGLKWIKQAVMDPELPNVLINTMAIFGYGLLFTFVPVAFAILISQVRSNVFRRIVQTFTTLPYFISWILVYSLMYSLFSSEGMVNTLIKSFFPENGGLNVLGNSDYAWLVQTFFGLWKSTGWSAIIYLAAITGIDLNLYEAADIDGAGRFRKIWHITLPGIRETFLVLLLLGIANMLSNGFEQFFVFINPLVAGKLNVLDYYVYTTAFRRGLIPLSIALGMYKSIISISLLFIVNLLAKKLRDGRSII
jgi:putative aldouronate transport system permease protein